MSNSTEFNPYRKWLGIPESQQPPTYYRLLAIAEFEDDADVISNAADRCMGHVHTFQAGEHAAASQRILNELAAARICLLTPDKKAAYDQHLRGTENKNPVRVGAPPTASAVRAVASEGTAIPTALPAIPAATPMAQPVPAAAPVAHAIPVAAPVAIPPLETSPIPDLRGSAGGRSVSSARRRSRKKSSPIPLLVGAAVVVGSIVIGVIVTQSNSTSVPNATTPIPPSPTESSTLASSGVDAKSARINSQPSSGSDPAPDEETFAERESAGPERFAKRLEHVRTLIKSGRLENARPKLDELDSRNLLPDQAGQVTNLRKLIEYLAEINGRLETAWERFAPGSKLSLTLADGTLDSTARVLEKDGESILVQRAGEETTLVKGKVPAPWAVALLRPQMEADPPRQRLLEIVCHLFLRSGDDQRARELYTAAEQEGAADAAIAAELGIAFEGHSGLATDRSTRPEKKSPSTTSEAPLPMNEESAGTTEPAKLGKRQTLPDEAKLEAARKAVDTRYAARIRDVATAEEQETLVATLTAASQRSRDDPAAVLALSEAIIRLRVAQGDAIALIGAIDQLAEAVEIDALQWKFRSLAELASVNQDVEQNEAIYSVASNLILEARSSGHEDRIGPLATLARDAALRTNNWRAVRDMHKLAAQHGQR